MTRRSRAREVALQLLFQRDLNPNVERSALEEFAHGRLRDPVALKFCLSLYDGVATHGEELDKQLTAVAENWRLPRMAVVDRNVLRLGAFELLFSDNPPAAVINEAIELARRFGSADSPAFVNGILDRLKKNAESAMPNAQPAAARPRDPTESLEPVGDGASCGSDPSGGG